MDNLEKGHYYRFQSSIYFVEEVFPEGEYGNRYKVRDIASHDSSKIWINLPTSKTYNLADGLDGVRKAEEDLHSFLVWALTQDYAVFYVDR